MPEFFSGLPARGMPTTVSSDIHSLSNSSAGQADADQGGFSALVEEAGLMLQGQSSANGPVRTTLLSGEQELPPGAAKTDVMATQGEAPPALVDAEDSASLPFVGDGRTDSLISPSVDGGVLSEEPIAVDIRDMAAAPSPAVAAAVAGDATRPADRGAAVIPSPGERATVTATVAAAISDEIARERNPWSPPYPVVPADNSRTRTSPFVSPKPVTGSATDGVASIAPASAHEKAATLVSAVDTVRDPGGSGDALVRMLTAAQEKPFPQPQPVPGRDAGIPLSTLIDSPATVEGPRLSTDVLSSVASFPGAQIPATMTASSQGGVATSSVPQIPLTQHFSQPQWGQELGQKISWMSGQNIQRAELLLHPANLWTVEVSIVMQKEQMHVSLQSHSVQVREALDAALPRLREMLQEGGAGQATVDVSARGQGGEQTAGEGQSLRAMEQIVDAGEDDGDDDMPVVRTTDLGRGILDHYA